MSKFENVTVIKQANMYFDGQVFSRSIMFNDGSKKTLGLMLPGEYEFDTDKKEIMEIMSGELELMLPHTTNWKTIKGGEKFEVPSKSKFKVKIIKLTDYCCSYIG